MASNSSLSLSFYQNASLIALSPPPHKLSENGSFPPAPLRPPIIRLLACCKAQQNSGKGGQSELVDANIMSLRTRIEDLRSRELMQKQAQCPPAYDEFNDMKKYYDPCRHFHHQYTDAEGSTEKWMKWEREYHLFYKEEVCCMMARLQNHLLKCRPSVSIALLLCMCLCAPIGAFCTLSTFTSWLLPLLANLVRGALTCG